MIGGHSGPSESLDRERDLGGIIAAAATASKSAYAPYSGFFVGAAVLTARGTIYSGCNVENIAHLSTHAEEGALSAARLAEGDTLQIVAIAVYAQRSGGQQAPCSPCGACRQRILEFGPDIEVHFFDGRLEPRRVRAHALLPHAFVY
jgi:cytidine deaminase